MNKGWPLADTPAVLLLGGRGTRISSLYPDRPKALVPVLGQPILKHQLEWMARNGLRRVHLAAGHLADCIFEWLSVCDPVGDTIWSVSTAKGVLRVSCTAEPRPLGTAGGLQFAWRHLGAPDAVWVLNGDSLMPDLNFGELNHMFQQTDSEAVLALAEMRLTGRYGCVDTGEGGRVLAFHEKEQRAHGWVNGGVYLIRSSVLESIPTDEFLSLETVIFPELAARGVLRAVLSGSSLLDMGTPEGLKAMERTLQPERASP